MSLPGVRALNEVDFDIHASEAHALIGEDPPANPPSSRSTQVTAQITGRGVVPR